MIFRDRHIFDGMDKKREIVDKEAYNSEYKVEKGGLVDELV